MYSNKYLRWKLYIQIINAINRHFLKHTQPSSSPPTVLQPEIGPLGLLYLVPPPALFVAKDFYPRTLSISLPLFFIHENYIFPVFLPLGCLLVFLSYFLKELFFMFYDAELSILTTQSVHCNLAIYCAFCRLVEVTNTCWLYLCVSVWRALIFLHGL